MAPFDPTLTLPNSQNDGQGVSTHDPYDLEEKENSDEAAEAEVPLILRSLSRRTVRQSIDEVPKPAGDVYEARPTSYWTGRFISLNDKLMTDAHDLPDPRDGDGEDKMRRLEIVRSKQIFETLQDCCKTPMALTSLKVSRTISPGSE